MLVFEAEVASHGGQWMRDDDYDGFTGGGYLSWTGGNRYGGASPPILRYEFTVSQPGEYFLTARALRDAKGENLRDDEANDFYARANGGEWTKFLFGGRLPWNEWVWAQTFERKHDKSPAMFELDAGAHVLEIAPRSSHVSLDRLHLNLGNRNFDASAPPNNGDGVSPPPSPPSPPPAPSTLSLVITADAISENGGTSLATVTRSGPVAEPLVVTLGSNDASEATTPAMVTIPAGQDSATFTVSAIDDAVADGAKTVAISASAPGFSGDADTVRVVDDDAAGSTLLVRVGGQGPGAAPPRFEVFADGVSLGVRTVTDPVQGPFIRSNDALYDDFVFSTAAPPEQVAIRFLNDGSQGQDRNLYVDFIEIDGVRLESEAEALVVPDNPASPLGGAREDMLVEGVMTFGAGPAAGPSSLTVRAGGQGAPGQSPQFEVFADGVSLGVRAVSDPIQSVFFRNDDALYESFAFNLAARPTSSVEIVFLNDGSTGGVDRNLYVDFIEIDGVRIEAEAEGEVLPDNPQSVLGGAREDMLVNATMLFDELPFA